MSQKTIIGGNGAVGSNTNRVFRVLFDPTRDQYVDFGTFDDLVQALIDGKAEKIIVPVRNSIIGIIEPAMNAINKARANGVMFMEEESYSIPIYHALISGPSGSLKSVRKVYSYFVAFAQCRDVLDEMNLEEIPHPDTYGAVADVVARNLPEEAAIGPIEAAQELGGKILKDNMSSEDNNTTIFKVYSLI